MEATARRRSLQERFESTALGRIVISIFLLIVLVTLVTANLPDSTLQEDLLKADKYILYGAALDQSWEVFAPDPRRETIHVQAQIRFSDGSQKTWEINRRNPVIGSYEDYRWLKWAEYVVSPAYPELSRPIAVYLARKYDSPGRHPTQVTLTNRWYALQPPGQIPPHPFIQERTISQTQITPEMLR
jgi:hypothetical protein